LITSRIPGRGCRTVPRPRPHNPCRVSHGNGLAFSAFARHYSRNHGCFLLLWVLRCFTSPRSLRTPYVFRRGSHHMTGAGFPHSDILGSTLGWQLPEAYRSLLRPSSAPGAQASTVCPEQFGHTSTRHSGSPECPKEERCSRPLCSSQRPTSDPPAGAPPNPHPAVRWYENRKGPEPRCTPAGAPKTGARGGARSLRTQQRAYDHPPRPGPVPHPRRGAVLGAGAPAGGRTGQRSTLEHHPRNPRSTVTGRPSRPGRGPGPPSTLGGQCSLERR
jgi:hypothetical protein